MVDLAVDLAVDVAAGRAATPHDLEAIMEQDLGTDYEPGLESTDPADADADLGDAISDGTSNTFTGKGGSNP
jgi:hypothetical protein